VLERAAIARTGEVAAALAPESRRSDHVPLDRVIEAVEEAALDLIG